GYRARQGRAAPGAGGGDVPALHRGVATRGDGVTQHLRPVRVGVVGAGALGFHHIRLLKKIDGSDLVGFYDHNPARSAQVAKELETTAFPSLEVLLERVEAVTVVVPTPAHVEVALPVLERGLHALVEKPLA